MGTNLKTGKRQRKKKQPPGPRAKRKRAAGKLFEALMALQARLRAPDGCPWDREQTHDSLRTYLLEEAYEVLDALDSGSDDELASELGDLLLQVVFHAQLAAEQRRFTIADVIEQVHNKMVRRHPHVFGDAKARTATEVLANWEHLKATERKENHVASGNEDSSHLGGIPRTLPAVLEAYQLTRRASRIGFDWDNLGGLMEKLAEESAELHAARANAEPRRVEEEVGDLLFVAVNVARFLGIDPEIALKKANRKFSTRFRAMEARASASGRRLSDLAREEMEALWEAAKRESPPVVLRAAGERG